MNPLNGWHACACGKRGWINRKLARRHLRHLRTTRKIDHRPQHPMHAYRCDYATALWHIGHDSRTRANLNDPRLRWIA